MSSKDKAAVEFPGLNAPAGLCHSDDPFSTCKWVNRDTWVKDYKTGNVIFEQKDVECPEHWTQEACNILASKYFYGLPGTPQRETSVRAVLHRIARTITDWGISIGHFAEPGESGLTAESFYRDLVWLMLHQYLAFNSPVWFNMGLYHVYGTVGGGGSKGYWYNPSTGQVESVDPMVRPQASACFILKLQDSIRSIFDVAGDSAALFKFGSGVGMDLSPLRSFYEPLSGGGKASGPVSFGGLIDETGGTIKSGGRTRRAAIMLTIKDRHPEFPEFINVKRLEEKKAKALIDAGYPADFNGEAYGTVGFQNANLSARLTNEFLSAAKANAEWQTFWVTDPKRKGPTLSAAKCLDDIVDGTWECGDPGVQFEDTIQDWHTCPNAGLINSSNPCCFVGATLVDTSEGRISIEKLQQMAAAGETLPLAFGYDLKTQLPVLRPIRKAWVAGRTRTLVEVETQRGLVLRCTPEHRFLLHDGSYVEAQLLTAGTRLRKINRTINDDRAGRASIMHRVTDNAPNGCEYQNRWMWEQVHGQIPEDSEVHHVNEDPTDDRLSNFELVPLREHRQLHSIAENNSRFIDVEESLLVETWEAVAKSNNGRPSKLGTVTCWRWNSYVRKHGLQNRVPLANSGKGIRELSWAEFEAWIEERQLSANDRVACVRRIDLDTEVPVYDIEVEGVHNFGVTDPESKLPHTIVVSNSEFMFLDDTSCNLASLRLTKFVTDGAFNVELFKRAVRILFRAMEIMVGEVSYPTVSVAEKSHDYRPLGIGYADLGAMLMTVGVPYDSDNGRGVCGAVTALMTGEAYRTSAYMAMQLGAFEGYEADRSPMLRVIRKHHKALGGLRGQFTEFNQGLVDAADEAWFDATVLGEKYGFRNAQASVLAPTGTIAFVMDCATTGIEPELGLVKYKNLAGGGNMRLANPLVGQALRNLGYEKDAAEKILAYVAENGRVEGCASLKDEHLPVFDTSLVAEGGARCLSWKAHIGMMAAAQPFISGAISKTINFPKDATREQIREAIFEAWRKGLKAVAMYRDGSKWSQPLSTSATDLRDATIPFGQRRKLPKTREAFTHHFRVGGHDGYVTPGMYKDGTLGEIFIKMNKEGSTVAGLMDTIAILTSVSLQHGVPLELLVDKLSYMDFEPRGMTDNPQVPTARSVVDYIFRWLGQRFDPKVEAQDGGEVEIYSTEEKKILGKAGWSVSVTREYKKAGKRDDTITGPPCQYCGSMTIRTGPCFSCQACGNTTGGCG